MLKTSEDVAFQKRDRRKENGWKEGKEERRKGRRKEEILDIDILNMKSFQKSELKWL